MMTLCPENGFNAFANQIDLSSCELRGSVYLLCDCLLLNSQSTSVLTILLIFCAKALCAFFVSICPLETRIWSKAFLGLFLPEVWLVVR